MVTMTMMVTMMVNEVVVRFTRNMWVRGIPDLPVEKFNPPVTMTQLADILKQRHQLRSIRVDDGVAMAIVRGH